MEYELQRKNTCCRFDLKSTRRLALRFEPLTAIGSEL